MIENAAVRQQVCELYKAMSTDLVGYARLVTGSIFEAEDVVDEAFHDLCQQWTTLQHVDDQGRRAWLRRVVRNKAISSYRKQHRIVLVDPMDDLRLDQPASHPDLDRSVLARDLLDRCGKVLHAMSPRRRMALLLHGEGYSSRQIGVLMGGIKAATVRGYYSEALDELREKVGDVIKILDGACESDWEDTI